MSNDRKVYSVTDFLRLLIDSRLIAQSDLDPLLQDFSVNFAPVSKYGKSLTSLGTYLVAKNILTCWQFDAMCNGRWKGFFLDQYKLVDHVGTGERTSSYLAEDTTTGKCVELAVSPPTTPLHHGKTQYSVWPFDRE